MRRNSVIQILRSLIQILNTWVIYVFQVRKLDSHRSEHKKGFADPSTQPPHFTGRRPKEVRGQTQTIRAASIRLETGTQVSELNSSLSGFLWKPPLLLLPVPALLPSRWKDRQEDVPPVHLKGSSIRADLRPSRPITAYYHVSLSCIVIISLSC